MQKILVALLMLGLGGCTTNSATQVASNESDQNLVCKNERVTGSSRPTRVCRTAQQIEADRVHGRQVLREMDEASISVDMDPAGMQGISAE